MKEQDKKIFSKLSTVIVIVIVAWMGFSVYTGMKETIKQGKEVRAAREAAQEISIPIENKGE